MKRRTFLTAVSAATIGGAGCAEMGAPYCRSGYTLSLQPVNYASVPERVMKTDADTDVSPFVTTLISTVLDSSPIDLELETTPNLLQHTPNERDRRIFFKRDGTFYEISIETREEGLVTGPKYKVSRNSNTPDDVSSENVLPISDLPYHDQWRLYENLALSDTDDVLVFSNSFVAGYHDSAHQAESMLVAGIEQQYIEYNGQYIKIEEIEGGTASIDRIRISAESVATNVESAGEYLVEQNGIDAADLSADGQDLIEKLTEERTTDICVTVSGGESDSIEEATVSEQNAMNELELEYESTIFAEYSETVLYIQYEGDVYELDWDHTGSTV